MVVSDFGDLYACRWQIGNRIPITELVHGHSGKGEARFIQDQRMLGCAIESVDWRGVDARMSRGNSSILFEMKYVQRNPRILTGDSGAEHAADLLSMAFDAMKIARDVLCVSGDSDGQFDREFLKTFDEFSKRRVSQKSWKRLQLYIEVAVSMMSQHGIFLSGHPWFLEPAMVMQDVHSLFASYLLEGSDVLVLMKDWGYFLVPRWRYDEFLQFKGEVSPASVPNLSSTFPKKTHWLTDTDEIFDYTERMYEYVVRYKSSNVDPNTGKKKNNHGDDTRTAA